MEHQVLYRKWRPQNFNSVIGQQDNMRVLKNAVAHNRCAHAYLFCGTRGTGKTSTARILAKALNCEHPVDGEPCNECDNCRAITEGSFLDVIEIDGASNRRIDEARELLEKVYFVPAVGKYKVYIIDEVHMLTTEAFNALLKTIEEPPAHVVFIMATTEARKVPMTILSRCQRFDFKSISEKELTAALMKIAREEGVDTDEDAIALLAEKARGSMRDALTLMDQAIGGERIMTVNELNRLTGSVPFDFWPDFFRKIASDDLPGVFSAIDDVEKDGKDLRVFFRDFQLFAGDLLSPGIEESHRGTIRRECASFFEPEQLLEIITVCGESEQIFRNNRDEKAVCRFLMAKIMKSLFHGISVKAPVSAVAETVKKQEKPRPENTEKTAPDVMIAPKKKDLENIPLREEPVPVEKPVQKEIENTVSPAETVQEKGGVLDESNFELIRAKLLNRVKELSRTTFTWVSAAEISSVTETEIVLSYPSGSDTQYRMAREPQNEEIIKTAINDIFDRPMKPVFKMTAKTDISEGSLFENSLLD